jgi:hypothetical protein
MQAIANRDPRLSRWAACLTLVVLLGGCQPGNARAQGTDKPKDKAAEGTKGTEATKGKAAPGTTQPDPATSNQIKEQPSRFYGKKVTVVGEVDKLFSGRAFELEGTGWAFDDNITVLTRRPIQLSTGSLADDDEVIVTGTVRPFVVAEVERDLDWDLERDLEVRLESRPVIIAETIRRTNDQASWSVRGGDAKEPVSSLLAVISATNSQSLTGRPVELRQERVLARMGEGLWVGPSQMARIFVKVKQVPADVQVGDHVRVNGTIRQVPADAAEKWGLPSTMQQAVDQNMLFVDNASVQEVRAASVKPTR